MRCHGPFHVLVYVFNVYCHGYRQHSQQRLRMICTRRPICPYYSTRQFPARNNALRVGRGQLNVDTIPHVVENYIRLSFVLQSKVDRLYCT